MKRDEVMLFALTFLTGAALGMYMYVAVWKPVYFPEDLGGEEASASEWSIAGERRQGYIDDASFRLLEDGSYTFIAIDEETGESSVRKEGSISRSLVADLKVSDETLASYEQEKECGMEEESTEYQYHFTVDGNSYLLDTCETELGHNTELAQALMKVWQNIEGQSGGKRTPAEWVTDWINQNLGVNKREE